MTFNAEEAKRLSAELASWAPACNAVMSAILLSASQQLAGACEEVERLRGAVLRPLTEAEVVSALYEGRAEAMAATGDNAWSSLLADRDRLAARVAELERGFVSDASYDSMLKRLDEDRVRLLDEVARLNTWADRLGERIDKAESQLASVKRARDELADHATAACHYITDDTERGIRIERIAELRRVGGDS